MLGFSIPKIIFLFLILIIIWNIFRYIEKKSLKKYNAKNYNHNEKNNFEESLIECEVCGNFYSNNIPEGCLNCNTKK